MENQYQALTDQLGQQLEELIAQYKSLKQENEMLKSEIANAQNELASQREKIVEYKANYERLKLAKAFGMSETSKKQAHLRITQMVREIDTCLALLKE